MEKDRLLARLACAAAHDHSRKGEWAEAFELALLPLHQARCHPLATIHTQLHGMYIRAEALRTLEAISGRCPDPLILERTLGELRRMEGDIRHELVARSDFLGGFAALRSLKRAGYPVDLSSGKSGAWYFSQLLDVQPDFPAWMLGQLPSNHPWRPLYTNQIVEQNLYGIGMKRESRELGVRLYRALFPDRYYLERRPNHRGTAWWQQPARDAFDAATRVLEQRIAELHRVRSAH